MAPTTDFVEVRNRRRWLISLNSVRTVQPLKVLNYEPPSCQFRPSGRAAMIPSTRTPVPDSTPCPRS